MIAFTAHLHACTSHTVCSLLMNRSGAYTDAGSCTRSSDGDSGGHSIQSCHSLLRRGMLMESTLLDSRSTTSVTTARSSSEEQSAAAAADVISCQLMQRLEAALNDVLLLHALSRTPCVDAVPCMAVGAWIMLALLTAVTCPCSSCIAFATCALSAVLAVANIQYGGPQDQACMQPALSISGSRHRLRQASVWPAGCGLRRFLCSTTAGLGCCPDS